MNVTLVMVMWMVGKFQEATSNLREFRIETGAGNCLKQDCCEFAVKICAQTTRETHGA